MTVLCTYRVKRGKEAEFREVLAAHWPTLRGLGLMTDAPPPQYRYTEQDDAPVFVEIVTWVDGEAAMRAYDHPEAMAIWERLDALTEARNDRPSMEFPRVDPLQLFRKT
jgi:hypothetical protein